MAKWQELLWLICSGLQCRYRLPISVSHPITSHPNCDSPRLQKPWVKDPNTSVLLNIYPWIHPFSFLFFVFLAIYLTRSNLHCESKEQNLGPYLTQPVVVSQPCLVGNLKIVMPNEGQIRLAGVLKTHLLQVHRFFNWLWPSGYHSD